MTTYYDTTGAKHLADCKQCLAGYLCATEAVGALDASNSTVKCADGHYCVRRAFVAVPCPYGTYLAQSDLGTGVDSCVTCPEHYYCEKGQSDPRANACPAGTICPLGSGFYTLCEAGKFCAQSTDSNGHNVIEQNDCTAGYYCPQGTSTEILCTDASLCPAGSKFEGGSAVTCPAG